VWERYAKIFEKGASQYLPTFVCERCSFPIKPYALGYDGSLHIQEEFSCPNCGKKYSWKSVLNEDDVVGYTRIIMNGKMLDWEGFKRIMIEQSKGEFIPLGYTQEGDKLIVYGYAKGIAPLVILGIILGVAAIATVISFATGAIKLEDIQKLVSSTGMWAFLIAITIIGGLIIYEVLKE